MSRRSERMASARAAWRVATTPWVWRQVWWLVVKLLHTAYQCQRLAYLGGDDA